MSRMDDIYDDEYSEQEQGSRGWTFKIFLIWVIFWAVVAFVFWRDTMLEIEGQPWLNAGLVWWFLLVLVGYVIYSQDITWKHKTAKFVCSGDYTSWSGDFIPCGDWIVVKREAIRIPGFNTDGGGPYGCVVVPRSTVSIIGRSGVSTAQVKEVPFDYLPYDVQQQIAMHRVKPPYKMGFAGPEQHQQFISEMRDYLREGDEEAVDRILKQLVKDSSAPVKDPPVSYLIHGYENALKESTMLRRIIDMKFKDWQGVVSSISSMGERARFHSFKDYLSKTVENKNGD